MNALTRCFSSIALCSVGILSALAQSSPAQSRPADRIASAADLSARIQLPGHRPLWATAANDAGIAPGSLPLTHITLILNRDPATEAAFQQLLLDQQNPASPRFHHWLTPAESGKLYGVSPNDLAAVSAWLSGQGLHVDDISPTGILITFSGTANSVGAAFSTRFHYFSHNGVAQLATTSEPAVPAAFAPVVKSFVGLSEMYFQNHAGFATVPMPEAPPGGGIHPDYTSGTTHLIAPKDFATIYDINAVYNAGISGGGYKVAVLGASRVLPADVSIFETNSGLAQYLPNVVVLPTGADPGMTSDSGQGEATLDVDRVIATAPGAGVDLLITSNAFSFNNIAAMLNYEISTLNDPIVNMSFGACEAGAGTYTNAFDTIFAQGAAQGITFVASSGDSGAAACDAAFFAPIASQFLSADFICASSYVTCVGGTEFADTASPSTWWSSSNATYLSSALSYIPEGAWNEPAYSASAGTYSVAATGGGVSTVIAKPSWQTGVGVPADGFRDTPDVAFSSSNHNGYFGCLAYAGANCTTFVEVFTGTSAAAPSMAGVMALVDQKLGIRQGNFNPTLYRLAALPSRGVFHDATIASSGVTGCVATTPSICNNSDPAPYTLTGGLAGYTLATGYDQATGWGSIDVANLLSAAALPAVGFTVTASPASLTLSAGATSGNTSTLTYTSYGSFAATINQTCTVTYNGAATLNYIPTCSYTASTVTLAANGTATGILTVGSTVPHLIHAAGAASNRMPSTAHPGRMGGAALAVLILALIPRRRLLRPAASSARWTPFLALTLGLGVATLSGCGSAGSTAPAAPVQAPPLVGTTTGSYTITVTSSSGSTTASPVITIALTIQ